MKTLNIIAIALYTMLSGCGGGGGGATTLTGPTGNDPIPVDVTPPVVEADVITPTETNTTIVEVIDDVVILTLNTNTIDSDGDGMTDVAELEYGYDPEDISSLPIVPTVIPAYIPATMDIQGTGIGAYIEITKVGIIIKWVNPTNSTYSLSLDNGSDSIYYGGHYIDYAVVNYADFNLTGNEILTGHFIEYSNDAGVYLATYSDFTIDLSGIALAERKVVGNSDNHISFTFKDFDSENEVIYSEFLKRVWPIMLDRLGTPAENFNTVITNMGPDSPSFMIVDKGRTFLSTQEFIPRLIVHEFIHAWKGDYQITSDVNWDYHTDMSGFEEGLAEGFAFEIIHEYTKAYPYDSATEQLLGYKPYQYNSVYSNHYDAFKLQRNTGAGHYWTITGSEAYRYSASAVTVQNIAHEYPNFYKDTQTLIYQAINSDSGWRPTRENIMAIWVSVAPTVQGIALDAYLNALPVFQGHELEDGFYIQNLTRHYGSSGDQQFSIAYVVNGSEWWNVKEEDIGTVTIPNEVNYIIGDDGWVYPDMQAQPYSYDVITDNAIVLSSGSVTPASYTNVGTPASLGWDMPSDLSQNIYDVGLYRTDMTFDSFSNYETASESFYFFGQNNYDIDDKYVLMIGIDTLVSGLTMTMNLDGLVRTTDVVRSLGYFRFENNEIPKGYEGIVEIDVTSNDKTCSYTRTLLDTYTLWDKSEFGYIIIDKDFNCIEDIYE